MPVDGRSWADVVRGRHSPLSYWTSTECEDSLHLNGASKLLISTYSSMHHLTDADVEKTVWIKFGSEMKSFNWKILMCTVRRFYLDRLMKKNNKSSIEYQLSKVNSYMIFFVNALIAKDSYLLHDVPLVAVTVFHICRKVDDQRFETAFKNILNLKNRFCEFSGIPCSEATKYDIIRAELECLRASDWRMPVTCSHEIMEIMFKRVAILTKLEHTEIIEDAWKIAQKEFRSELLVGKENGFLVAKNVTQKCLRQAGFNFDGVFSAAFGLNDQSN